MVYNVWNWTELFNVQETEGKSQNQQEMTANRKESQWLNKLKINTSNILEYLAKIENILT